MSTRHCEKPKHDFDPEGMESTARAYYLCMLTNGRIPLTLTGGPLDGLNYFEIELDNMPYWVTEHGIFYPMGR
jgi:hypothetical protein